MSDSETLARFTDRIGDGDVEAAPLNDFVAFGWLRGIRDSAPMLELRKKTGTILAVGYSWLEKAEFDPSEGIFLDIGDQRIAIRGRNLNAEVRPGVRLFEGITRHRVSWILEIDGVRAMAVTDSDCVVESIDW